MTSVIMKKNITANLIAQEYDHKVSIGGAVYENGHSLTLIDIGELGSFSIGLSKHPEFGCTETKLMFDPEHENIHQ